MGLQEDRLLLLLGDGGNRTISELAVEMNVKIRTIYRIIERLNQQGYPIDSNMGVPQLLSINDSDPSSLPIMQLTHEEELLLDCLLNMLDGNQSLKSSLRRKLVQMLGHMGLERVTGRLRNVQLCNTINKAMEQRCQVILNGYASGHSATISDRLIEPVQWSSGHRQLHAFDVDKGQMRTFVISRISNVTITNKPYQHQSQYHVPEVDCFWMSGTPQKVTLRMSLLALNLLHEEYPLSTRFKEVVVRKGNTPLEQHLNLLYPYKVTLEVRSMLGVGRFVMGLVGQVLIVKGDELKTYIANNLKQNNLY